jgi:hypothetical protein
MLRIVQASPLSIKVTTSLLIQMVLSKSSLRLVITRAACVLAHARDVRVLLVSTTADTATPRMVGEVPRVKAR